MTLPIFHEDRPVAVLDTHRDGLQLHYERAWREASDAFPISLSMPLEAAAPAPEVVAYWLMNLLPEGEPLRAMTRALGVAREDLLGLMSKTGRDLAGALTIGAPRAPDAPRHVLIAGQRDLERIIEDLPAKPFLVGEDGVSMSLAGAQEKLPLAREGDDLAIPINGAPSTLILKPDNPRLPGSVQNEALCMVLARRCGLPSAPVATGLAGARAYLLVERYDRRQTDGRVLRIHQEDFCQALARPPSAKYQHNRTGRQGPSLAEMFALVRAHMTAREITRLLDAVIFNIAIGNVDSHAKNYSILLSQGRPTLAPLYDLMSGLVWPNITQNHAQDIGGQQRGRHVYARHWRRMAQAAGLAPPATIRRVGALAARIVAELPAARDEVAAMAAGADAGLTRLVDAIAQRAALVGVHAADEGGQDGSAALEPADETGAYPS